MKIEVCEQMMASWLQHIKGCQVVQTNWSPSPTSEISDDTIDSVSTFVNAINDFIKNDTIDIFKKSTIRQMIQQCEIDIVGLKIVDGGVGDLYLIDSAFHESGLNYANVIATVMKKILRATLVSGVVFPSIPANVMFISPKCRAELKGQLETTMASLETVVKNFYPDTNIIMLFNEGFAETVYKPLFEKLSVINNDNDLFVRSMKLAEVASSFIESETTYKTPIKAYHSVDIGDRTPKGSNRTIVLGALKLLISEGYMTPELLNNLCNNSFAKANFRLSSYPVLVKNSDFIKTGYQDCRFYSNEMLKINGENYRVCSQWIPERIRCFNLWLSSITKK